MQHPTHAATVHAMALACNGITSLETFARTHVAEKFEGTFPMNEPVKGPDGWIEWAKGWREALAPLQTTFAPCTVSPLANPNEVLFQWTTRCTFSHPWGGFENPHGKQMLISGIDRLTFDEAGKICSDVGHWDPTLLERQLRGFDLPEQI